MTTPRFYIVSDKHSLVDTSDDQQTAEDAALVAAVHTARTVYVHDRMEELNP